MGVFRNVAEKLGFKTYSLPVDSFMSQLKGTANGKAEALDAIECYDIQNNIVHLDNSGEVEAKIIRQNGKSTVLYFDTLYIENGELHGSNSKFLTNASFTKKSISVNEIATIELQANKKALKGTKGNKKAPIKVLVTLLIVIVAGNLVPKFFTGQPSFDKVLEQAAGEVNKSCPVMADKETRLDNAVALPNNTLQYNYTLVNIDKSDPRVPAVKQYVEQNIPNNVKTSPDMKIFRDNKTTMAYNYRDKNGVFLFKILVTPDQYNQ